MSAITKKKKRANESKLRTKEEVITTYMNIYQGFNFEKMLSRNFSGDTPRKDLIHNYQAMKEFGWDLMNYAWVCNFSRPEFGFSTFLEFDMFDESKLEFGTFVDDSMRNEILELFVHTLGQLESGKLKREECPKGLDQLISALIKVEKKLCLDKYGKDHELFAGVDNFETEDFQNLVEEGDPNYCGRQFESLESIELVDQKIVKKLADYFGFTEDALTELGDQHNETQLGIEESQFNVSEDEDEDSIEDF